MRTPSFLIIAFLMPLFFEGIALQSAKADGFIIIDHPVHIPDIRPHPPHLPHPWPRPRPPRPINRFLPLEVREHHVSVSINGQIATTAIDQTFYNPSGQRLEGTYIFPIPEGAQIDKFLMDVNGKMTTAELLDAKKARSIYEDIVRRAKDPALMEYSGQGMFKVRIFPIEPHKEKRIKIKYTQLLKRDGRITEYTYPLNTEKFSSRPIKSVSVKVDIESEHELKSIYSPSHEIDTSRKGKHKAVVGFEENDTLPDSDFRLFFASDTDDGKPIGLELFTYRGKDKKDGGEGYYMMLLSPGAWQDDAVVPKDVVFAVDTSGSMRVKKLEQAKAALQFCLGNLNKGDRFEIIRYSTEAEALFEELSPASKKNLSQASEFISGLKAGGGTAIEEALLMAVTHAKIRKNKDALLRPFQVIFLTDGRPTIGETRPDKILERLAKVTGEIDVPVRVFSFGIGTDINTKLLDRIAEDTRAVTEYVLPEENIEHKVSRFYAKISQPVMANIKLKTKGGIRLSKRHPNELPDLFKDDQLVVFGRYAAKKSNEGKPVVTLVGTLAGKSAAFTYKARFDSKSNHEFIPRLWATRRVGYLLDEIRLHGEKGELKDEVVALARRWGIVTPYTSYLIIEDEETRGVPLARQSMGQRPSRPSFSPSLAIEARSAFNAEFGTGGQASEQSAARYRRDYEKKVFDGFAARDTGGDAVAAARSSAKLKTATKTNAAKEAYAESLYGNQIRFEQQVTRIVAGKTFYQNNKAWVDAEVAEKPEAEVHRIAFGSDEYFKLLARSATTAKWLSVAGNLQVLIDGEIYEITSTKEK
jgi:Ca-activated chloride channel family protein